MRPLLFAFIILVSLNSFAQNAALDQADTLQLTLTRIDPERVGLPWFRSQFDFSVRVSGIEDPQNNSFVLKPIDWQRSIAAKYEDYARPNLVVKFQIGEIIDLIAAHLHPDRQGYQIEIEGFEKGKVRTYNLGKAALWLSELTWLKSDQIYGRTRTFEIHNYAYLYQSGPLVSREGFWAPCYGNWPTLRCFFLPREINIGDPRTSSSSMTFEVKLLSGI